MKDDLGIEKDSSKLGFALEYQGPRFGVEFAMDQQDYKGFNKLNRQITVGGQEKLHTLRSPAISGGGANPTLVSTGFSTPAPSTAGPTPGPTQGTPQPPPAPGSVAQQETEARMLVSDLLEIGMQQRKAYEEAQKKAAAEKKKS